MIVEQWTGLIATDNIKSRMQLPFNNSCGVYGINVFKKFEKRVKKKGSWLKTFKILLKGSLMNYKFIGNENRK